MKTFLKILVVCLLLTMFVNFLITNQNPETAYAQSGLNSGIACSADGQYVYVFKGNNFYKSDNYGKDFKAVSSLNFRTF